MASRVLILDGSDCRDIYRPDNHWRRLLGNAASDVVHLPAGDAVPRLEDYSHLIVTGSEASVTSPAPWFGAAASAVREAVTRGCAVLGGCFGHQMLAWALSGPEYTARAEVPEIGWIPITVTASDPLLGDLPQPLHAFVIHFDEVREPPAPWTVLAHSPGCAVQAMRYGDHPVWGVQFHPEMTPEDAKLLMGGLCTQYPELASIVRPHLRNVPRDDEVAAVLIERFLAV